MSDRNNRPIQRGGRRGLAHYSKGSKQKNPVTKLKQVVTSSLFGSNNRGANNPSVRANENVAKLNQKMDTRDEHRTVLGSQSRFNNFASTFKKNLVRSDSGTNVHSKNLQDRFSFELPKNHRAGRVTYTGSPIHDEEKKKAYEKRLKAMDVALKGKDSHYEAATLKDGTTTYYDKLTYNPEDHTFTNMASGESVKFKWGVETIYKRYEETNDIAVLPKQMQDDISTYYAMLQGLYSTEDAIKDYYKKGKNFYETTIFVSDENGSRYEKVSRLKSMANMPECDLIYAYYRWANKWIEEDANGVSHLKNGAPDMPVELIYKKDANGNFVKKDGQLVVESAVKTDAYTGDFEEDLKRAWEVGKIIEQYRIGQEQELTNIMKSTAGWDKNANDSIFDVIRSAAARAADGKYSDANGFINDKNRIADMAHDMSEYMKQYVFNPLERMDSKTALMNGLVNMGETCDVLGVGARAAASSIVNLKYSGNHTYTTQEDWVYSGGEKKQKLLMELGAGILLGESSSKVRGNTHRGNVEREREKEKQRIEAAIKNNKEYPDLWDEYKKLSKEWKSADKVGDVKGRIKKAYLTNENYDIDMKDGNLLTDTVRYTALDPMVYITLGAGGVAKAASKGAARKATKQVYKDVLKDAAEDTAKKSLIYNQIEKDVSALGREIPSARLASVNDITLNNKRSIRATPVLSQNTIDKLAATRASELRKAGIIQEGDYRKYVSMYSAAYNDMQGSRSFKVAYSMNKVSDLVNGLDKALLAGGLWLPYSTVKTVKGIKSLIRKNGRVSKHLTESALKGVQGGKTLYKKISKFDDSSSVVDLPKFLDELLATSFVDSEGTLKKTAFSEYKKGLMKTEHKLSLAINNFVNSKQDYTARLGRLNDAVRQIAGSSGEVKGGADLNELKAMIEDIMAGAQHAASEFDDGGIVYHETKSILDNMHNLVERGIESLEQVEADRVKATKGALADMHTTEELRQAYLIHLRDRLTVYNCDEFVDSYDEAWKARYLEVAEAEGAPIESAKVVDELKELHDYYEQQKKFQIDPPPKAGEVVISKDSPGAQAEVKESIRMLIEYIDSIDITKEGDEFTRLAVKAPQLSYLRDYLLAIKDVPVTDMNILELLGKIQKAVDNISFDYRYNLKGIMPPELLPKASEYVKDYFVYKNDPELMAKLYDLGVYDYYKAAHSYREHHYSREFMDMTEKRMLEEEGDFVKDTLGINDGADYVSAKEHAKAFRELQLKLKESTVEVDGKEMSAYDVYLDMCRDITTWYKGKAGAPKATQILRDMAVKIEKAVSFSDQQASKTAIFNVSNYKKYRLVTEDERFSEFYITTLNPDRPLGKLVANRDELLELFEESDVDSKDIVRELHSALSDLAEQSETLEAFTHFTNTLNSLPIPEYVQDIVLDHCFGIGRNKAASYFQKRSRNMTELISGVEKAVYSQLPKGRLYLSDFRDAICRRDFIDRDLFLESHQAEIEECVPTMNRMFSNAGGANTLRDVKAQLFQYIERDPQAIKNLNKEAAEKDVYFLSFEAMGGNEDIDGITRISMKKYVPIEEGTSLADTLKIIDDPKTTIDLKVKLDDKYIDDNASETFLKDYFASDPTINEYEAADKLRELYKIRYGGGEEVTENAILRQVVDLIDTSYKKTGQLPKFYIHGGDKYDLGYLKRRYSKYNDIVSETVGAPSNAFQYSKYTFRALLKFEKTQVILTDEIESSIIEAIVSLAHDLPDGSNMRFFNPDSFSEAYDKIMKILVDPAFESEYLHKFGITNLKDFEFFNVKDASRKMANEEGFFVEVPTNTNADYNLIQSNLTPEEELSEASVRWLRDERGDVKDTVERGRLKYEVDYTTKGELSIETHDSRRTYILDPIDGTAETLDYVDDYLAENPARRVVDRFGNLDLNTASFCFPRRSNDEYLVQCFENYNKKAWDRMQYNKWARPIDKLRHYVKNKMSHMNPIELNEVRSKKLQDKLDALHEEGEKLFPDFEKYTEKFKEKEELENRIYFTPAASEDLPELKARLSKVQKELDELVYDAPYEEYKDYRKNKEAIEKINADIEKADNKLQEALDRFIQGGVWPKDLDYYNTHNLNKLDYAPIEEYYIAEGRATHNTVTAEDALTWLDTMAKEEAYSEELAGVESALEELEAVEPNSEEVLSLGARAEELDKRLGDLVHSDAAVSLNARFGKRALKNAKNYESSYNDLVERIKKDGTYTLTEADKYYGDTVLNAEGRKSKPPLYYAYNNFLTNNLPTDGNISYFLNVQLPTLKDCIPYEMYDTLEKLGNLSMYSGISKYYNMVLAQCRQKLKTAFDTLYDHSYESLYRGLSTLDGKVSDVLEDVDKIYSDLTALDVAVADRDFEKLCAEVPRYSVLASDNYTNVYLSRLKKARKEVVTTKSSVQAPVQQAVQEAHPATATLSKHEPFREVKDACGVLDNMFSPLASKVYYTDLKKVMLELNLSPSEIVDTFDDMLRQFDILKTPEFASQLPSAMYSCVEAMQNTVLMYQKFPDLVGFSDLTNFIEAGLDLKDNLIDFYTNLMKDDIFYEPADIELSTLNMRIGFSYHKLAEGFMAFQTKYENALHKSFAENPFASEYLVPARQWMSVDGNDYLQQLGQLKKEVNNCVKLNTSSCVNVEGFDGIGVHNSRYGAFAGTSAKEELLNMGRQEHAPDYVMHEISDNRVVDSYFNTGSIEREVVEAFYYGVTMDSWRATHPEEVARIDGLIEYKETLAKLRGQRDKDIKEAQISLDKANATFEYYPEWVSYKQANYDDFFEEYTKNYGSDDSVYELTQRYQKEEVDAKAVRRKEMDAKAARGEDVDFLAIDTARLPQDILDKNSRAREIIKKKKALIKEIEAQLEQKVRLRDLKKQSKLRDKKLTLEEELNTYMQDHPNAGRETYKYFVYPEKAKEYYEDTYKYLNKHFIADRKAFAEEYVSLRTKALEDKVLERLKLEADIEAVEKEIAQHMRQANNEMKSKPRAELKELLEAHPTDDQKVSEMERCRKALDRLEALKKEIKDVQNQLDNAEAEFNKYPKWVSYTQGYNDFFREYRKKYINKDFLNSLPKEEKEYYEKHYEERAATVRKRFVKEKKDIFEEFVSERTKALEDKTQEKLNLETELESLEKSEYLRFFKTTYQKLLKAVNTKDPSTKYKVERWLERFHKRVLKVFKEKDPGIAKRKQELEAMLDLGNGKASYNDAARRAEYQKLLEAEKAGELSEDMAKRKDALELEVKEEAKEKYYREEEAFKTSKISMAEHERMLKFAKVVNNKVNNHIKHTTVIDEYQTSWAQIILATVKYASTLDSKNPLHFLSYLKVPRTNREAFAMADHIYNLCYKGQEAEALLRGENTEAFLNNVDWHVRDRVAALSQLDYNPLEGIREDAINILKGDGIDLIYKNYDNSYLDSVYYTRKIDDSHAINMNIDDILQTQRSRRGWADRFATNHNTPKDTAFEELEHTQISLLTLIKDVKENVPELSGRCRQYLDDLKTDMRQARSLQVLDFVTQSEENLVTHLLFHNQCMVIAEEGSPRYMQYIDKLNKLLQTDLQFVDYSVKDKQIWIGLKRDCGLLIQGDSKYVEGSTKMSFIGFEDKVYDAATLDEAYEDLGKILIGKDIKEYIPEGIDVELAQGYLTQLREYILTCYEKLGFLTDGAIKGSMLTPYNFNRHKKLLEAAPDEFISKTLQDSTTFDQRLHHTSQFDFNVIGETGHYFGAGAYNDADILQDIKHCYEDLEGVVSTERMYIDNFYGANSHCKIKDLLAGYSMENKLEILKGNTDQCVLTIVENKHTQSGFAVKKINIRDALSVKIAEETDAIVVPYDVYVEMVRLINTASFDKSYLKVWSKLLFMLKVGHLCNPGTWLRNWVDATLKATVETGDVGAVAEGQVKALDILYQYNKLLRYVRKEDGIYIGTARTISEKWDYYQKAAKVNMTREQFEFIESWLRVSLSGGESEMVRHLMNKLKYDSRRSLNLKAGKTKTMRDRLALRNNPWDYVGEDMVKFEQLPVEEVQDLIQTGQKKGMNIFFKGYSEKEFWDTFNARVIDSNLDVPEGYEQAVNKILEVRNKKLLRGPENASTIIDSFASWCLKPMSKIEQVVRLGQFLTLEDKGYTRSQIFKSIADTQFEYELKSTRMKYAELGITYCNFEYNNMAYWCRTFENNPKALYMVEHMWETLSWRATQNAYDDEDVYNNRSIAYMMANGGIPIGKTGLYLKMYPSYLGTLNWFYGMPSQYMTSVVPPVEVASKELLYLMGGHYAEVLNTLDYSYKDQATWEKMLSMVPIAGTMYTRYYQHFAERQPWTRIVDSTPAEFLAKFNPSVFGAVYRSGAYKDTDFAAFQKRLEKQGKWYDCNRGKIVDISLKNTEGLNNPNLTFQQRERYMMIYHGKYWDKNWLGFKDGERKNGHWARLGDSFYTPDGDYVGIGLNRVFDFSKKEEFEEYDKLKQELHGLRWCNNAHAFIPKEDWREERLNKKDIPPEDFFRYMEEDGYYWDFKDKKFKRVPKAMTAGYYAYGYRHFRRWVNYGNRYPSRYHKNGALRVNRPYSGNVIPQNNVVFGKPYTSAHGYSAVRMAYSGYKSYDDYYRMEYNYNYRNRTPNPITNVKRYNPIIRYHIPVSS